MRHPTASFDLDDIATCDRLCAPSISASSWARADPGCAVRAGRV